MKIDLRYYIYLCYYLDIKDLENIYLRVFFKKEKEKDNIKILLN